MNAKTKLIAAVTAFAALAATAAGPWYVAKEDANAADTLVDGRGTEALPFRTIQAALDNPAFENGDTVYVKRGVYDEGMKYSNFSNFNMTNRVFITKPVHLKAVDGKAVTTIAGYVSEQDSVTGCGTDSIRCIGIASSATGTTIEDFTFRDGRTTNTSGSNREYRRGGGIYYDGTDKGVAVTDCYFIDCRAPYGGAACRVVARRCLADSCRGWNGAAFDGCALFSCVIVKCSRFNSTTSSYEGIVSASNGDAIVVNTTFALNTLKLFQAAGKFGDNSFTVYNCVFAGNSDEGDQGATVANSTKSATASEKKFQLFSPAFGDFRLVSNATAIGFGLASWTNALVSAGVDAKYLTSDFLGAEIVPDGDGKVNAGAVQTVAPASASAALEIDSAADLNDTRIPAGAWICSETWPVQYKIRPVVPADKTFYAYYHPKVSSDQEQLRIYQQPDGNMYVIPPPATAAASQKLTAKYAAAEIWVDPSEDGSDEDGDGTESAPYKTLQKAVDMVTDDYTLIRARRGEYASGGKTVSNLLSRVDFSAVGTKCVLLRAEDGPEATAIVGESDSTTLDDAGEPGCGASAARCAMLNYNTAIQGFTLKGGRTLNRNAVTDGTTSDWGKNGAAVYGRYVNSHSRGQLLDCVVTNCIGVNSVLFACHAKRCRVVGNTSRSYLFNRGEYMATLVYDNVSSGYLVNGAASYMCTYARNTKHAAASEYVNWSANCIPQYSVFVGGRAARESSNDYGNYVWNQGTTASLSANSTIADPLLVDIAGGDLRPFVFSPVIHGASATGNFYKYVTSDFQGKPLAISADGLLSAGACQSDLPSAVVISAPNGGLLVNGEPAAATNVVEAGATATYVLSGDADATRWCMGVSVDGEETPFDSWPGSMTMTFASSTQAVAVTALYSTNWYVDAVGGSDANKGFTAATAKKTLADVFTNCAVTAGDVVNVLPGTYDVGTMKRDEADLVFARAVVPEYVTIRATSGAANTVIMGGELTRCLFLGREARAEGFTLTGGQVLTSNAEITDAVAKLNCYGGGVHSLTWSDSQLDRLPTVIDCIISNNLAFRAGGGAYARFVKCRFHCNTAADDNMSAAGYGTYHHCIVDGNFGGSALMYPYEVYNCTLGPRNYKVNKTTLTYDLYFYGNASRVQTFNSIVFRPANDSGYYRNCVLGSDNGKVSDANKGEGSILTNMDAIAIGDDYRPLAGSPAIDMGVPGLGSEGDEWFPETDLGGVPRVM